MSTSNTTDEKMPVGGGLKVTKHHLTCTLSEMGRHKWEGNRQTETDTQSKVKVQVKGRHLLHSTDKVLGGLADFPSGGRHSAPGREEGCAGPWVPVHFHRVAGLHGATSLVV